MVLSHLRLILSVLPSLSDIDDVTRRKMIINWISFVKKFRFLKFYPDISFIRVANIDNGDDIQKKFTSENL